MKGSIAVAILGVVLAAVLGFAAHLVAQDTVGLPAVRLEGGQPLAPEEAEEEREDGNDAARPATTERVRTRPAETEPSRTATVETRTEDEDDESGNSGPGSEDSDSGSDDSGRGRGRGRGRSDDD